MDRPRLSKPKGSTKRQLILGATVAFVVAQVVAVGMTGQGSVAFPMPDRWSRRGNRDR